MVNRDGSTNIIIYRVHLFRGWNPRSFPIPVCREYCLERKSSWITLCNGWHVIRDGNNLNTNQTVFQVAANRQFYFWRWSIHCKWLAVVGLAKGKSLTLHKGGAQSPLSRGEWMDTEFKCKLLTLWFEPSPSTGNPFLVHFCFAYYYIWTTHQIMELMNKSWNVHREA